MAMDKNTLFTSVVPEEDVELEGKGVVRVRALTRDELHRCNSSTEDRTGKRRPGAARDAEMLAVCFGMVDPVLDINEVKEWSTIAAVGEFQKVVKTIMRLSNVGDNDEELEEAQRQAYDDFRE